MCSFVLIQFIDRGKMKQENVWVFDLDDTLISNVHDYAYPILDACRLIIDVLGDLAPHVSAIVALEQEIDRRRVQETNPITGQPYGYSMERFPTSLIETYREICHRASRLPEQRIEKHLMYIGLKAFDSSQYKRNVYPDTITTLSFLQTKGDHLLLLTKGDERVQNKKLSVLKANERFARIEIVSDRKTSEIFKEMVSGFSGCRLFSVGNDFEKDIAPALKAGYRGVWIPVETWEVIGQLDEIRARMDRSRCIELRRLQEIVEKYDEILKGEGGRF